MAATFHLRGRWRSWLKLALLISLVSSTAIWLAGEIFTHPVNHSIGPIPGDLRAEAVQFRSNSGRPVHGWFVPGRAGRGVIVLLPGVRGDRTTMLGRGRILADAGRSILLIDFQATGESPGDRISFGYHERLDAQGAVQYVRQRLPGERVGAIGVSLGGAAALLADLDLDAWVLEMVYPSFDRAVGNRTARFLGPLGQCVTPLLTMQCKLRFGVGAEMLRPIDHIGRIQSPKLLIAGSLDPHTPLVESQALFAAATGAKELWIVPGAKHVDAYAFAPEAYRRRVLAFFERYLIGRTTGN